MHIKITVRYHLIPVRTAIIKKSTNNKYWGGCGEKKPSSTAGGNVSWAATMDKSGSSALEAQNRNHWTTRQVPTGIYLEKIYGFDPWVGKIPWGRGWQPTHVFSPGESHGLRSLVGYSTKGWNSQTRLSTHTPAWKESPLYVNLV